MFTLFASISIVRLDVDKTGELSQTDLAERLATHGICLRDIDFHHLIARISPEPVKQLLNCEQLCQVTALSEILKIFFHCTFSNFAWLVEHTFV